MKTKRAYLLMTAFVLPLLFFAVACDSGGSTSLVGDVDPSVDWFRVDCFTPEGTTQMAFAAKGAVTDEGIVEGDPLPENAGSNAWVRYRIFHGEQGILALRIEARSVAYGARVAEGTFKILGGSDAYAILQGEGDFHATLSEEAGLVEIFEGLVK